MTDKQKPPEPVSLKQAAKYLRRDQRRLREQGVDVEEPRTEAQARLEAMLAAGRRGRVIKGER